MIPVTMATSRSGVMITLWWNTEVRPVVYEYRNIIFWVEFLEMMKSVFKDGRTNTVVKLAAAQSNSTNIKRETYYE